jgi:DNA polymerase III epsilon subunit-like protein
MKTQVMLDLETLGAKPGSVIVAIGAVKFGGGQIIDSFYERIDPASCVEAGLKMDPQTIMWWLTQPDAARLEITKPGAPLAAVLAMFTVWVGENDVEIWGNGASFDNVLLSDAYEVAGMPRPWKFYNERCYRTVKNLRPDIQMAREGVHHHALDDARSQAEHLMRILETIPTPVLPERVADPVPPASPEVASVTPTV